MCLAAVTFFGTSRPGLLQLSNSVHDCGSPACAAFPLLRMPERSTCPEAHGAALQPYQPSLSAAWLFQRSMALQMGQLREARGRRGAVSGFLPPDHVNRLLAANFRVMQAQPSSYPQPLSSDLPSCEKAQPAIADAL